jgi:hypothetical protein
MGQAGVEVGDAVRVVTDGRFGTRYLKSQRIFANERGMIFVTEGFLVTMKMDLQSKQAVPNKTN